MNSTSAKQVFEYRTPGQINFQKKWIVVLLWIALAAVVVILSIGFQHWGDFQRVFYSFLYLITFLNPLIRYYGPKWCSLTLIDDALIYIVRLPFGLNALFGINWRISLRDITTVEVIQSPLMGDEPTPGTEQLRISQRDEPMRYITPAMWFTPGAPACQSVKPVGKRSLFASPSTLWTQPENQSIARSAFADLPVVQALRARGIEVPDIVLTSNAKDHDLFGCRSIKFGIVAGLTLILTTLGIVTAYKHQHLQIDFSLVFYFALAGASLLTLLAVGRREALHPPVLHSAIAAIFLVVGVSMAAQPLATLFNGLGVDADQFQTFTVHAGSLEPIDGKTGIGPIYLFEQQSRQTWLKEGAAIALKVKKGRLGLWEYDDSPLRLLANH